MLFQKTVIFDNTAVLNLPVDGLVLTPVLYAGKVIVPVHMSMTFLWAADVTGMVDNGRSILIDWLGFDHINWTFVKQSIFAAGGSRCQAGNINASLHYNPLNECANLPVIMHTDNGGNPFTGGDPANRLICELSYILGKTEIG
jgi:hypothetical protein